MVQNIQGRRVSDHLDMIRGLAAVAVVAYHIRYRFFFDYRDASDPGYGSLAFYTLTAFGHDAVMVFFVLSGYFISGSVLRDRARGRWSWRGYAVNRASRLYLVLIPGLLLTVFWDSLGMALYPRSPIYTGEPRTWVHDFFPVGDRLGAGTFAGNVFFLQTVLVPPLGSNDPLWSLAFEFWYYVLFPLALSALGRGRVWKTAVSLIVFGLLLAALGRAITLYFPLWLLGTAVYALPQVPFLRRTQSVFGRLVAVGLFGLVATATHLPAVKQLVHGSLLVLDYVNAVSFALLLYYLLHDWSLSTRGQYSRGAGTLAGFSFTLYVVHMPLLVFLRAALVEDTPWPADPVHAGYGLVLLLVCLIYAYGISRLTEAHTAGFRDRVMNWLRPPRRAVPTVSPSTSYQDQRTVCSN